jgi:hypothetical protein
MLKLVLGLGLTLVIGSVGLGVDFSRQNARHADGALQLDAYLQALPARVKNFSVDREKTPGKPNMPQVRSVARATLDDDWSNMSNSEQIDAFASSDPTLKRLVAVDRAQAKQRWWDRIRQKFSPDEKTSGNRLADIKARNAPLERKPGIDPAALGNMSAGALYTNRAAIQQGMSNTAANRMNDIVSGMEEAGVDLSDYRN